MRCLMHAGTIASLCLVSTSCATGRVVSVGEVEALGQPSRGERLAIHGYTTVDGQSHKIKGHMVIVGDSLRFEWRPGRGLDAPLKVHSILHRDEVATVRIRRPVDSVKGLAGGVLIFAVLLTAIVAVAWMISPPDFFP